jgi:glycosyltransferase involved in cell wall biosynthesis
MPKPLVDIVIAVHDAYEAFEACLAGVREHGGYHRLILVDDASTDERVGALLRRLSAERRSNCLVLRNESRLGFAGSVNRGIESSRGDVVVLGPQARVTRAWLHKLSRCAASDPRIGTVAPFGDEFPECSAADLVNMAVEAAAVPLYPELPAATGFCLYVRRRVIDDIGMLEAGDEDAIAGFQGRTREAGYRNILCDDAYVAHTGFVALERGAHDDRLRPLRAMVRSQLEVVEGEGKPGVLHVVHPRGGGTEKYIRELVAASSDDYRHYFLRIFPERWRVTDADGTVAYDWPRDAGGEWLRSMRAWLRIDVAHVHSLVGSGDDFLRILSDASLPYCYSVHDMYLPCPTVYLIDSEGRYCDATTDPELCRRCLSKFDALASTDIVRWRARYARFLAGASKVYAPSAWAGGTLAKYYPGIAVTVAPPPIEPSRSAALRTVADAFSLPDDECRHIGVLGAIGPEKGARLVEALVVRIRERRLPLRIVVIGYTDRESRHQADDRVLTIHGPYQRDEIAALLDHYRIGLLAFPTIWPETFGYTLSEGWAAGRPALVPPRGALRDRILATGAGWIMERWPDVDAILDQMMRLTAAGNRADFAAKSRLAKDAFDGDVRAGLPAAILYRDVLAPASSQVEAGYSRYTIYEAACRALGVQPLPSAARDPSKRPMQRRAPLKRLVQLLRG